MPGFDNDWRCKHDNAKGCPNGGCDAECARDAGWQGKLTPGPQSQPQPAPQH
jgi:hypothetical protein